MVRAKQAAEKGRLLQVDVVVHAAAGLCAVPAGHRLMNLIQPGTDVPGYRLFSRPCRDCFVPVSKALRTSQQIPEQSAVAT